MPQFAPITDAYIDDIIKSAGPYNPSILKTQGVKLRELIKMLRDRLGAGNVSVDAYDPQRIYALGELMYVDVDNGSATGVLNALMLPLSTFRLLYQSTANNNQGTFGGISYIENTQTNPIPPQNFVSGYVFPFPAAGLVYDEALELPLLSYDPTTQTTYEAVRIKLKKDDGRVVGLYASFEISDLVAATNNKLTVVFKVSSDPSEDTEVVFEKSVIPLYSHVFFMTKEGISVKVALDVNQIVQLIDMTLISPSLWKLIGYPQEKLLDTFKFINTGANSQVKSGALQISSQFSNKIVRKLYEVQPNGQRDTINGYLQEEVGQITGLTNTLNKYVVLGFFYSEGYFQNSFEITIIAYDGAVGKKYNVLQTYSGNGDNYIGTNSASGWFELTPQTDGGSRGTNNLVLEGKYKYPYGWFIRAKMKSTDTDAPPEAGRNFGYYIKAVQGDFFFYGEQENLEDIGPKIGIDSTPVTMSYGPTQIAQRLKLGLPKNSESNFTYLTRDNLTGEVKQTNSGPAGNTAGLIAVSYEDLVNLITTATLAQGKKYLLTDYMTCWKVNSTMRYADSYEPLILTAVHVNKLDSLAISAYYPKDQIYYAFGTVDYMGEERPYNAADWTNVNGIIPQKGMIYRRIDTTKNNDINFDFRGFWVQAVNGHYSLMGSLGMNVKIVRSDLDTFYNRVPTIWGYQMLDNCNLVMTDNGYNSYNQSVPATLEDLKLKIFNSNVRTGEDPNWSFATRAAVTIENCGNVNLLNIHTNSPSLKNILFMELSAYQYGTYSANVKAILANNNTKLSVKAIVQEGINRIEIFELAAGVLTYTNEVIS